MHILNRRGESDATFCGKEHSFITFAAMYAMGYFNIWWFIGGIIGSYLPDCDHPLAPAGHIIPLHLFMKHRTYPHSLMFSLIFASFGIMFNRWYGYGVLFGYLMHLLADRFGTYTGLTQGLPYLYWPFKIKKAV